MAATSPTDVPASSIPPTSRPQEIMPSPSPVEMSDLTASTIVDEEDTSKGEQDTAAGAEQQEEAKDSSITPRPSTPSLTTSPPEQSTTATTPPKSTTQRRPTEALGPATDAPIPFAPATTTGGPCLNITLMLITGARHPYKIDEKYLRNRKVEAKNAEGEFDPREMSAYKLKELIWTDWRSEWEARPQGPSSIRLIILGRLMDDKANLKDFPFKMDDTNVVHMTVKPADFDDDQDTGGKKGQAIRGADGEERGAGCCRCVIL